jgi:2-oxoglutarate dehydrogenase E1 component
VVRPWRKPLVVMTPKGLLRHPLVVSSLDDCAKGSFQRIIPDAPPRPVNQVRRILLCSGKIYYELAKHRQDHQRDDVAILRLEQLYPLHQDELESLLKGCSAGTPAFWAQEEPENMGAWRFLRAHFGDKLFGRFPFAGICRPASASPATGWTGLHKKEQTEVVERAFGES